MGGGGKNSYDDVFVNLGGAIETLFDDQNQPWFKKAHVGKFLEITDIKTSTRSKELRAEMCERLAIPTGWITPPWSGPKDLENRHVARCGEYDNILVCVQKNKPIEIDAKKSRHAFYMMRCQKRRKGLLMVRLKKEYPHMSEKGTCENPNAVHQWCWFKEDVLREDNYYRNHFSLDTTTKREFEYMFGINMD